MRKPKIQTLQISVLTDLSSLLKQTFELLQTPEEAEFARHRTRLGFWDFLWVWKTLAQGREEKSMLVKEKNF